MKAFSQDGLKYSKYCSELWRMAAVTIVDRSALGKKGPGVQRVALEDRPHSPSL